LTISKRSKYLGGVLPERWAKLPYLSGGIAEFERNARLTHAAYRVGVVFEQHLTVTHLRIVKHLGDGVDGASADIFVAQKRHPGITRALSENRL
jgi:hypothetical protein